MIWQAKSIALLILAFGLFSCNKSNRLGFDDGSVDLNYVDSFSVEISTILKDSIVTSNHNSILVGNLTNANFGTIASKAYFNLELSVQNKVLGKNPIIKSTVLYLATQAVYGTSTDLKAQLFELTDSLITKDYTSKDSAPKNSTPAATFTVENMTANKHSTVTLLTDLGEKLLSIVDSASQSSFNKNFFGLALVPQAENSSLFKINLNDADSLKSFIRLNYTYNDTDTTTKEAYYDLYISNDVKRFTHITSDRSTSTELKTLTNTNEIEEIGYIQGAVGESVRLKFPSIKTYFDGKTNLVINKAELQVPVLTGSEYLNNLKLDLIDTEGNVEEIGVSFSYAETEGKYTLVNYIFSDEILYQIRNNAYKDFMLSAASNDRLSQVILQTNSDKAEIKLKIYYSDFE